MIYFTTCFSYAHYAAINTHTLKQFYSQIGFKPISSMQHSLIHSHTELTNNQLQNDEYKTCRVKLNLGLGSRVHKLDQTNPLRPLIMH